MSSVTDLVDRHVAAMLAEARELGVPDDVLGRKLLAAVIRIYAMTRSWDDISSELQFTADNLDPSTEFAFIRP